MKFSQTVEDVPCLSCQRGYNQQHKCDSNYYCPCDQGRLHQ